MLVRLALGNVRRSLRDYAVYFMTIVLGVAVFYAFNTIADQAGFLSQSTSDVLVGLGTIMSGLTVFLACVFGFLMVYANNYLVRRRKRELSLYQVLGMHRSRVSAVLLFETLAVGLASFAVGIALGVLVAQLLVFVTAALFQDQVTQFAFQFSPAAFMLTLVCFGIVFLVMVLFNAAAIRKVSLTELMVSERANERIKVRSIPAAVMLFVLGAALIGVAYVRFTRDGLPLAFMNSDEGVQFLVTTLMLVVGTLLFFYALSGFLLALVQRIGGLYWHGLNMFTLRQLNAKINTTSVSMAVISLILFLAITCVTGGMSICTTVNNSVAGRAPFDASVDIRYIGRGIQSGASSWGDTYAQATRDYNMADLLSAAGYDLGSVADYAQLSTRDVQTFADWDGAFTLEGMGRATDVATPMGMMYSNSDTHGLEIVSLSEFNAVRGLLGLEPIRMEHDEYLLTTDMGATMEQYYNRVVDAGYTAVLGGVQLKPADHDVVVDGSAPLMNNPLGSNPGAVVVSDDVACQAKVDATYINLRYRADRDAADAFVDDLGRLETSAIFVEDGKTFAYIAMSLTRADVFQATAGTTGIISYMAIYIGFVLVISCAAILAIQQLTNVSDAQGNYRLLSELGAPARLACRSLLTQTLVYFLFPLVVALAHSGVALHVVIDLVAMLGSLNITDAALAAGALFVVVYGGYLLVAYRASRIIVRRAMNGLRHTM